MIRVARLLAFTCAATCAATCALPACERSLTIGMIAVDAGAADAAPDLPPPRVVFAAPVPYTVGSSPVALALSDLDGDGDLDIVVADQGSDDATLLRGAGDGAFAEWGREALCDGPTMLAASDINRDGKADIAAVCPDPMLMTVRTGGGPGGSFMPGPTFTIGARPSSLVIADLDGRDKLDIAVGVPSGIALGLNGAPRTTLPTSPGVDGLVAGDLDGDGKADLVALTAGEGCAVLRGDGSGGFTPDGVVMAGTGVRLRSLLLLDYDGDGRLDVAGGFDAEPDRHGLKLSRGLGRLFADAVDSRLVTSLLSMVTADFDRDGHADIAGGNGADVLAVALGPLGSAQAALVELPLLRVIALAAGDLDRDGRADLAVLVSGEDRVHVLLNRTP